MRKVKDVISSPLVFLIEGFGLTLEQRIKRMKVQIEALRWKLEGIDKKYVREHAKGMDDLYRQATSSLDTEKMEIIRRNYDRWSSLSGSTMKNAHGETHWVCDLNDCLNNLNSHKRDLAYYFNLKRIRDEKKIRDEDFLNRLDYLHNH